MLAELVANGAVVALAGLPGSGKTTLADALIGDDVRVLDSDRIRRDWEGRTRVPYALWRPLVHVAHWRAIRRALRRGEPCVVVRPLTRAYQRRLLVRWSRLPIHLVALDVHPAQARAGQHARGRRVSDRAMRRHVAAWSSAQLTGEGWTSVRRARRPRLRVPTAA